MPRLEWNAAGSRFYEAGVDRGVLYVDGQAGVPWNGLTAVNENASGGDAQAFYIDGVKYLNRSSDREFEATITAFTYPDEFGVCDGTVEARSGLFITNQRRKSFGLSYRTMIGNDQTEQYGYKIHIIYNALAAPSDVDNKTATDRTEVNEFSWQITTKPPAMSGYKPTSHIVIDSRTTDPSVLELIEDILYGNDEDSARIPSLAELIGVYDTISTMTVTDNGDGTFTVDAPFDVIRMLDEETFEITSNNAVFIDEDTYTLSSE